MKEIKRITVENTALLMIDVQEKLIPSIYNNEEVISNNRILLQGAKELGLKTVVTEQYPQGLGGTVEELNQEIDGNNIIQKMTFSVCDDNNDMIEKLSQEGIDTFILSGIEAHICVYQTAKDLLNRGYNVYLVYDAVGSRKKKNHKYILKTLLHMGAYLVPTESVLFELMNSSKHPSFKTISKLIK